MQAEHDPYEALRVVDYRLLLSGSFAANIAGAMQTAAVSWEIYERTGSAYALGMVGLVQFLPVLGLTLPAGHAIDRHSRKGVFFGATVLHLILSLSLAALSFGKGPIDLVFLCLLLIGVARAFGVPARASLLAQVVPANLLRNAVTWNSTAWQLATVAGPALGGAILALNGPGVVYLSAAGCSAVCAIMLSMVKPKVQARPRETPSLSTLFAGARFVWHTKLILAAITLDLFAVLLGGAAMLLPIFAKDILHVDAIGFGWLRAAPSIGAFTMALVIAHRPPFQRAGRVLLLSVAGFGLATIFFGLSTHFALSFVLLAFTGAFDNISVVIRQTLVQTLTPDEMRGRVSAINTMFISSSNELGDFESGIVAEWFGPIVSVVSGGLGTLMVVLIVLWSWPDLQRLGPLHHLKIADEEKK